LSGPGPLDTISEVLLSSLYPRNDILVAVYQSLELRLCAEGVGHTGLRGSTDEILAELPFVCPPVPSRFPPLGLTDIILRI
jgi:hypothetical protein